MTRKPAKQLRQGAERRGNDLISERRKQAYIKALASGMTADQIACKLDPSRGRKYRRIRGQVARVVDESSELRALLAGEAAGEMVLGIPVAARALTKRAARGRPDAIKLLFEASGFHNPKVKHEHSGDISISLNMPRPPQVENDIVGLPAQASEDGTVVDAEVVEE